MPVSQRAKKVQGYRFDSQQQVASERRAARKRQVWTLVFAIAAIWVARTTSAQSAQSELPPFVQTETVPPGCIYYNDANLASDWKIAVEAPIQLDTIIPVTSNTASGNIDDRMVGTRNTIGSRPRYLQLSASLANFDADAEPDGWRIQLVLRDSHDRPVVQRAQARFELTPRVSRFDAGRFENTRPLQWSQALEFGEDGIARLKLPLRHSQKSKLGWPSDTALRSLAHRTPSRSSSTRTAGDWYNRGRYYSGRLPTVIRSNLRDRVTTPEAGELRVRVSVPSEGTFEATTTVWIRPSVLVDTRWP